MSASDPDPDCPLRRCAQNNTTIYNPPNAAVASCFQLHDTLITMLAIAHSGNQHGWEQMTKLMQLHLDAASRCRADVALQ